MRDAAREGEENLRSGTVKKKKMLKSQKDSCVQDNTVCSLTRQ